ncbi:preprotein translocase subunit SecG [Patescibacteria group bacterium]|nr:preprotein translocase subunit SecG [Patescibacteria group bacterium]
MQKLFLIIQIISAVLLVAVVLVQSKGKGFARSRGASASFTRRGLERLVFRLTFIIAAVFTLVSALQIAF